MNSKTPMISNHAIHPVYLVGAGPGDPELLTLKAVKTIGQASLILVDDLVNDEVLSHADSQARIIHVGKRGGCQSTPQAFIEKLMVSEALKGERVVRLKGGDPLIFGRGGEEIEALEAAGLEVKIINGISAALAAAGSLNTSLTHREHAHGVLFLTGHAKPGGKNTDWVQISKIAKQAQLSLVIYMGMSNATKIAAGLAHHLSPNTPVAIVQNASLGNERMHHTHLSALVSDLERQAFKSPCVLLIGDVFAAKTAWIESQGESATQKTA